MNERIRELGRQVGFYMENMHPGGFPNENLLAIEKFAELIIQECANLFPLTFTDEQYQRRIDKTILKHFGVDQ
jgi:hypothetical protein